MRILHLSTYDLKGGGARSTFRLHKGLLELGIDSAMFVNHKLSKEKSIINYQWPKSKTGRLRRNWKSRSIKNALDIYRKIRPAGFEGFHSDRSPNFNLIEQLPEFDLMNMHWVAGFVDFSDILTSFKDKPIVWRLSDLNPITGGCHYDAGCGKYLNGCHTCPQLGGMRTQDLAFEIWNRKKKVLAKTSADHLHFVAQSNWMANQIKASDIFSKFEVTVIPNGLDIEIFKPRDKHFSREILGIPKDKLVILFVSDVVTNRRKGFKLLIEALDNLSDQREIILCAVGNVDFIGSKNKNLIQLGNIGDDRLLSMVYSMADLFVIPSLQDNLPNTVIESIACGTPVVGFPIGGITDMIRHGQNGYLCQEVDVDSLTNEINRFIQNPKVFDRDLIRKNAVVEYDRHIQARRMIKLYKNLIKDG